eukprot:TRINITY_DN1419_c0_g2_i1.p1 TRINITY_DN1419_c0_g2~~TRINITY_DN1419_c0_g2_i1.p1  ORF type:complete len:125 (-),score=12.22 TRINITY_DN1419_c0_g2_i1:1101-1475(-)
MASRMQFAAPSHGAAASFRQLVHPGAVDTGSVNKSLLAEDGGRLLLRAAHTLPKTTLDSDLKDVATGDFGPPPVTGVDAINLTSVSREGPIEFTCTQSLLSMVSLAHSVSESDADQLVEPAQLL